MAKFFFKLQNFLNIKEKIEEQKKVEYGKAMSKLEQEKAKLVQFFEKKEDIANSIKQNINFKVNSLEVKKLNEYLKFLEKEILKQEQIIKEEEQNVEKIRGILINAMKERKMLESLKDKEKEEYLKEELRQEQKIIDEIVSYKYNKS